MSKGKIEIVFDGKGASICLDGQIGYIDSSIALGSVMGLLLQGKNEDSMKEALQCFIGALVDYYKGEE